MMKVLFALILLIIGCVAASAEAQVSCTQFGGYPWVQGGCLNGTDVNRAINNSPAATPPINNYGTGAGFGKYWLDTSTGATTPTLRQCINAAGCSGTYVSSDWMIWGIYNTVSRTIALASSVLTPLFPSLQIGATPFPTMLPGSLFQISSGVAGTTIGAELDAYAAPGQWGCQRTDGSVVSPTALMSGDEICSFSAFGFDGTVIGGRAASLRVLAGGNWNSSSHPTEIRLSTTPSGSTSPVDRLLIEPDGGIYTQGATGGDQGPGTINTTGVYINGAPIAAVYGLPTISVASSSPITAAMCGHRLLVGSGVTLTLPGSTTGFNPTCDIAYTNTSSTRGVLLSGFPSGQFPELFPGTTGQVSIVATNTWSLTLQPGRWRTTSPVLYYALGGSDTLNDGLTSGTPFATPNYCYSVARAQVDSQGSPIFCQQPGGQVFTNACASFFGPQGQTYPSIVFQATGGNGQWECPGGAAMIVGDMGVIILDGIALGGSGSETTLLELHNQVVVDLGLPGVCTGGLALIGNPGMQYMINGDGGNAELGANCPLSYQGNTVGLVDADQGIQLNINGSAPLTAVGSALPQTLFTAQGNGHIRINPGVTFIPNAGAGVYSATQAFNLFSGGQLENYSGQTIPGSIASYRGGSGNYVTNVSDINYDSTLAINATTFKIGLANIPALQLLANTAGGTNQPIGTSLSAYLDLTLGSTDNGFPMRHLGSWTEGALGSGLVFSGTALNLLYDSNFTVNGSNQLALISCASGSLLANSTASSAEPGCGTLTALLDRAISSAQGAILYRNGTQWVPLGPGTAGQLLQTGGGSANPSWATQVSRSYPGAGFTSALTGGATYYMGIQAPSATEGGIPIPVPVAVTLKNFVFQVGAVLTVGQTISATVRGGNNGSPSNTLITCTITSGLASCADAVHSAALTPGQSYDVTLTTSAGVSVSGVGWSLELDD